MASIFIRTVIIYCSITIAIKMMGKRQLGELEVSELVSTLLVSEIAALPIADPDIPLLNAIIPLLLIVSLEIIISAAKNKYEGLKKLIEGEPIFIIYKGRLNQKALRENRISINEVLCEMRTLGVGDISDVNYAILEQNGKLSILKNDIKEKLAHTIIIDKRIDEKNLKLLGYDGKWLEAELKKHGISRNEVFLMTVDDYGNTNVIKGDTKNESA